MSTEYITPSHLARALAQRDLTDCAQGHHAIQILLEQAVAGLASAWSCPTLIHRGTRVVSVEENYERLRVPAEAVSRDRRYSRYVGPGRMLRSHSSALVPAGLELIAAAGWDDGLLVCPGITYRRDCVDRLHTGEPHQVDLWRVRRGRLDRGDLDEMVADVVDATVPGSTASWRAADHSYTTDGREIRVRDADGEEVEIGEGGLAHPDVLAGSGLDPATHSGLALGLGLDRLVMLRKRIPDIRLLRSTDPRIAEQMHDLQPYRAVSSMPAVRRDLSVCTAPGLDAEELGDRVRLSLGDDADWVAEVRVLARTPVHELPAAVRERMGALDGQENLLIRVTLRAIDRSLTDAQANRARDRMYLHLHQGTRMELACTDLL